MPARSLAIISLHTSPLAQPGSGDGGGMNVYVRSLAAALAGAGVSCDVFTRSEQADVAPVTVVEPNFRVLQVEAGPRGPVAKEALPALVAEFGESMLRTVRASAAQYDVLHANYWLSGQVAHRLKHELGVPMVTTFHTLARVKAVGVVDNGEAARAVQEGEIIRCADLILASTREEVSQLEVLYGADRERIEVLPPGVDHGLFKPGDKARARAALGLPSDRVLLFVGRIQPLKGLALAIRSLAEIDDAVLCVMGGPSGPDGPQELARCQKLAAALGVSDRIILRPPVEHPRLVDYYQAADVCIVPSRTESFGLVALEAAACGTPVVAAAVGGLRSIVEDGVTGFLVEGRDPLEWATSVALLLDDPELAEVMGMRAAVRSGRWSWCMTAARLRRLCSDLVERTPVECS